MSASEIAIPCRRFSVLVHFGPEDGLGHVEQFVLRMIGAGARSVGELTQILCLPQRMVLDACIDLLRAGFLTVDRKTGKLALVDAVLNCMGPPDGPKKDWAQALVSAAPPEPREYHLMQDLVSGSIFPAIRGAPKDRQYPVAPINLDLPRVDELSKVELMLAVVSAIRARQSAPDTRQRADEIERLNYLGKYRVVDVTIPRRGGPTADPCGEINSLRAQVLVSARSMNAVDTALDVDQDKEPPQLPVIEIVGPNVLPAPIRRKIAAGLGSLWESGIGREAGQFFSRLRVETTEAGESTARALVVVSPYDSLGRLEEALAHASSRPDLHDQLIEIDEGVAYEVGVATRYSSSCEVLFGTAAHYDKAIEALQGAREQLVLACPWMGLISRDSRLRREIRAAVARGVRVHLIWGVAKGEAWDSVFDSEASQFLAEVGPKQGSGGVYVTQRPAGCHAKLILCDMDWAVVSSCNFMNAPRDRTTEELGVLIHGRDLTGGAPGDVAISGLAIDNRPFVSRTILDLVDWVRSILPDYRIRQLLSTDPSLFGRREDNRGIVLGGDVIPPDPTSEVSVLMWRRAWDEKISRYKKNLGSAGTLAIPVRDGEHRDHLLHAFAAAKKRVVICSPQIGVGVLGSHILSSIREAVSRGVTVTIIYAEERMADAIKFAERRRELEGLGVRFSKKDLHSKLIVADDWVLISSFNFLSFEGYYDNDRRARHEFGVRILDPKITEDIVRALGIGESNLSQ